MQGKAITEISIELFQEGLFRLAGENQSAADALLDEFKEALIEDITLSARAKRKGKSKEEILYERIKARESRKHYRALKRNLGPQPKNTAAHHIIPWYDKEAEIARSILRRFGISLDSQANGVYLPRYKKHVPHEDMPKAYAHAQIHTKGYYLNITALLRTEAAFPDASKEDIESVLEDIAAELADGTFPLDERVFS